MANTMLPGGLELKGAGAFGTGGDSPYDTWDEKSGQGLEDFLYGELVTQQKGGLGDYWKGGLNKDTAARGMAQDLAKSGITNLNQVGWSEKAPKYGWTNQAEDRGGVGADNIGSYFFEGYDENDPVFGKYAPGVINKNTGEALVSSFGERTGGNTWSGSYEGKGGTGFDVSFDSLGNPYFYTHGESTNDYGKVSPFLSFAAFAFPAIAPFVAAGNAAYNLHEGNTIGAITSALGAAGGLGGEIGQAAQMASKGINIANSIRNGDMIGAASAAIGAAGKAFDVPQVDVLGKLGGIARALNPEIFGSTNTESGKTMLDNNGEYDWAKILAAGGGLMSNFQNANQASQYANNMQGTNTAINSQINSLGDLYGQNSPYAAALRQKLERRDAAAGRRSQWGPREVELQAALAGMVPQASNAMANLAGQQNVINNSRSLLSSGANSFRNGAFNTAAGFLKSLYSQNNGGYRYDPTAQYQGPQMEQQIPQGLGPMFDQYLQPQFDTSTYQSDGDWYY